MMIYIGPHETAKRIIEELQSGNTWQGEFSLREVPNPNEPTNSSIDFKGKPEFPDAYRYWTGFAYGYEAAIKREEKNHAQATN